MLFVFIYFIFVLIFLVHFLGRPKQKIKRKEKRKEEEEAFFILTFSFYYLFCYFRKGKRRKRDRRKGQEKEKNERRGEKYKMGFIFFLYHLIFWSACLFWKSKEKAGWKKKDPKRLIQNFPITPTKAQICFLHLSSGFKFSFDKCNFTKIQNHYVFVSTTLKKVFK